MMKFSSKPVLEHSEVPLADDGRFEEIVATFEEREAGTTGRASACYVASVVSSRAALDARVRSAQLGEIVALVRSQGGDVVGQESCRLSAVDPRTHLGKGLALDLASRARAAGATMLVVDAELSPSQTRNLEDACGIAVCDREAVILNVFLRHARTRRARIQVEIAQLEYLRPRIRGVGLDMDQQTGGGARARGPGETASELLARQLDGRLEELRKAQKKLATSAETQRRRRDGCKQVVLVGYTNAGKTSLMNALTGAQLSARDMPFETLDTTSRSLTRHGGEVVLSDTVGFIRRLPERLLASFESTLDEIRRASLLVLVVDLTDPEREEHLAITRGLVARMGAGEVPTFCVFNKLDGLATPLERDELVRLSAGSPWTALTTRDQQAIAELEATLLRVVRGQEEEVTIFVPYTAAAVLQVVYAQCRVVSSEGTPRGLRLRVQGPAAVVARIRRDLRRVTS